MSVIYMPADNRWSDLGQSLAKGFAKKQELKDNIATADKLLALEDGLYSNQGQPQSKTGLLGIGDGLFGTYQFTPSLTGQSQQELPPGLFKNYALMIDKSPEEQKAFINSQFTGQSMQQPVFKPAPQQLTQQDYDNQAAFDQQRQEHPEWFRKGATPDSMVYVGDRPDLDVNATVNENGEVEQTQSTQKNNSQYSFSNPLGTPKPQSTVFDRQSIKASYRQQRAEAIRDLVKMGMKPQDAFQRVENIINQKVESEYSSKVDQLLDNERAALDDVISASNNDSAARKKAIWQVAKYNHLAEKYGKKGFDFNLMKYAIETDDLALAKEDNGSTMRYYVTSKNGTPISYETDENGNKVPVYFKYVGNPVEKTPTPDAQLSAETTRRGQDLSFAAAQLRGSGGSSGGSGMTASDARMVNAAKAAIGMHENWLTKRKDMTGQTPDPTESPYFHDAQQAQKVLQGYLRQETGYTPENAGLKVNYTGDPEIDQRIDQARTAGQSEEWINEKVYQSLEAKKNKQQTPGASLNDGNIFSSYIGF